MAFTAIWDPVFHEEENFCLLFGHAADVLMSYYNKTVADVAKSSDALCDELMRRPWMRDINFSGLNFNDLTTCCAYLKRYAACHSALARSATLKFLDNAPVHVLGELFNQQRLKIVSVGGGPGNDLVGFLSAMQTRSWLFEFLYLVVVDLKKGWSAAFQTTFELLQSFDYGAVSSLVGDVWTSNRFIQSDMSKHKCLTEVRSADVILMTKVLSVVPPERRKTFLQKLFLAMKPGAVFLYIDINTNVVMDTACDYPTYLLMDHPRDEFTFTINVSSEVIRRCSFEVCAIQKAAVALISPWTDSRYLGLNGFRRINGNF